MTSPAELTHMGVPVAGMPCFDSAQGARPAIARSIADLRCQGVRHPDGPDGYDAHPPKRGARSRFPRNRALAALAPG